jgi:hypothetical protein
MRKVSEVVRARRLRSGDQLHTLDGWQEVEVDIDPYSTYLTVRFTDGDEAILDKKEKVLRIAR